MVNDSQTGGHFDKRILTGTYFSNEHRRLCKNAGNSFAVIPPNVEQDAFR